MAKRLRTRSKIVLACAPVLVLVALALWYFSRHTVAVLEPAGQVGARERNLIVIALLLSVIVVVPVYVMAIAIAVRYREQNHKATYRPDWAGSRLFESLWWGVPLVIIAILSVITWQSSHALDPYKALAASRKPLNVQVVALDWKWLFIYPDQHIASVNKLEMPVNTPVNFQLTSDTVMNSFWVPQLGSQIYAMPGMSTQLHLIANKTGSFYGSSANISGQGFADMHFTAKAVSQNKFASWLASTNHSANMLDMPAYHLLAKPSQGNSLTLYAHVQPNLYNDIVMKYMMPAGNGSMSNMPGMSM